MDCKKIQGLILTDFGDNQMGESQRMAVERHLAACPVCKKFCETAQKATTGLFAGAEKVEPPEYLWQQVRKSILAEPRKRENFVTETLERLRYGFRIPRPAIAFATALALFIIIWMSTGVRLDNRQVLEEGLYFDNPEAGFETSIEEYFL